MNRTYELTENFGGYAIRAPHDIYGWVYFSGIYKGKYNFSTDPLYAKSYTLKTATKHLDLLNKGLVEVWT